MILKRLARRIGDAESMKTYWCPEKIFNIECNCRKTIWFGGLLYCQAKETMNYEILAERDCPYRQNGVLFERLPDQTRIRELSK
ncbi:hypothetical protein AGMMS49574_07630 [Bacteroidia bacterium]|nr:hypothetical protein AGMMS49574_07630 [Bacteroidia bacterium]